MPAAYMAPKAGFWQRFLAALLDGIIIALVSAPAWIVLIAGPTHTTTCRVEDGEIVIGGGPDNAFCEAPTSTTIAMSVLLGVAAFVAAVLYYSLLEGRSGQTLGKRAANIKVVDLATGGPIGTGRGVGRYFARWISALVCLVGYFWMLGDEQKQTWHDKLANSVVVRV